MNRKFIDAPNADIINMNVVNTLPQVALTQNMVPLLTKERVYKSAIIDLSSIAAIEPYKDDIYHYAATKRFNEVYTQGKIMTYDTDQLDWIVVKPGAVQTAMTNYRTPDLLTCDKEDTIYGVLKCLGKDQETYGSRKHEILAYLQDMGYLFFGVAKTRFVIYNMYRFFFPSKSSK